MAIMREYSHFPTTKETLSPVKAALYEGKKQPEAKIVKSQFFREQPLKVTFERLIEYHDATPQIRIAVSSYSELITGTEMVLNSENDQATDFLNEWVRKNNFYDKFENLVTTILITGNGILEKLSENDTQDVSEVDMATIISKKRTDTGELEWYDQRQQMGKMVKLGEGNLDRFIEFNLTNYSKQAWGRSLFYPLAVPRTTGERTMSPFVEVMWAAEDAMGAVLTNDAYPITTITYPGANDHYLEKETEKWRRYRPGDKRVQKIKPEIEFFESQHSAGRYQPHIEHLEKTFELGTQFPHDILTGDFTSRASSETTETIVMKLVRGYQRYLCNKLKKELFEPILEQNGFNTEEAELEVSFTAQNIVELTADQVAKLYTDKVITIQETRDWFRTNTGMELPDDDQVLQNILDATQQNDAMNNKVDELESKVKQISFEQSADSKLQEMQKKLEHKLNMVKEAAQKNNESLFKRRERLLEKLIEEADKLG